MTFRILLVALAFFAGSPVTSAPTVEIGGSRQILGTVTADETRYEVKVTFRPLRTFDAVTNEEVNRELAREFALRVLARHLSKVAEVEFLVGGDELVEAGLAKDRYQAVIRWPRAKVKVLTETPPAAVPTVTRVAPAALTDKFFTARQDYLDALAGLRETYTATLKAAVADAAAVPEADRRRVLARAVTRTEDRVSAALDALTTEVRADDRLLDLTERPELITAIAAVRVAFTQALRVALASDSKMTAKQRFAEIDIQAPFAEYLTANPHLMDLGGAVVIDLGPNEKVLIGVAKTILKDDGPEELLRAEKVCTLKARVAVVAERDGAQISYLKKVSDKIVVVTDASGERAKSVSERLKITQEKVAGLAKGLPVIGRWNSKTGKVFYLAVGGRFDATGEPLR